MKKAYFNWSGGKDSALALDRALQSGEYDVSLLFSAVRKGDARLAMHETGVDLLKRQAASIGLPLVVWEWDVSSSVEAYRAAMGRQVARFKEMGIETALFGDLYLEELRADRERHCAASGIEAAFPLWGMGAERVMEAFVAAGFKAVVTCVDSSLLGAEFLGREIDEGFLRDLPPVPALRAGVTYIKKPPCGRTSEEGGPQTKKGSGCRPPPLQEFCPDLRLL